VLAGCLTSPPCLITLGFFAVAAYIVVEVFVDAAQASKLKKPKPHPWTVPTGTDVPATADPPPSVDCVKVKRECLDHCSDTTLPTDNFGASFRICMRECMQAHGCVF
jgi:hypothetical protein